jgi:hypothetical protein
MLNFPVLLHDRGWSTHPGEALQPLALAPLRQ